MSLKSVIDIITAVSKMQPTVKYVAEGNIYRLMDTNPSLKYASIVLTQGQHTETDMFRRYNFTIFYVDRLVDNLESNRVDCQSTGIEVLSNIVRYLENHYDWEIADKQYTTYTEKFADECAGSYLNLTIEVPLEWLCEDDEGGYVPTVTITENGEYNINGQIVRVTIGG